MLSQLVSTTNFVVKVLSIFALATLFTPIQSVAQLPWTENFSNNNNEGVYGGCGTNPNILQLL